MGSATQERMAVVGAGPLGLMTLKELQEQAFSDVTGFEARAHLGGLWKDTIDSGLSVQGNTVFSAASAASSGKRAVGRSSWRTRRRARARYAPNTSIGCAWPPGRISNRGGLSFLAWRNSPAQSCIASNSTTPRRSVAKMCCWSAYTPRPGMLPSPSWPTRSRSISATATAC